MRMHSLVGWAAVVSRGGRQLVAPFILAFGLMAFAVSQVPFAATLWTSEVQLDVNYEVATNTPTPTPTPTVPTGAPCEGFITFVSATTSGGNTTYNYRFDRTAGPTSGPNRCNNMSFIAMQVCFNPLLQSTGLVVSTTQPAGWTYDPASSSPRRVKWNAGSGFGSPLTNLQFSFTIPGTGHAMVAAPYQVHAGGGAPVFEPGKTVQVPYPVYSPPSPNVSKGCSGTPGPLGGVSFTSADGNVIVVTGRGSGTPTPGASGTPVPGSSDGTEPGAGDPIEPPTATPTPYVVCQPLKFELVSATSAEGLSTFRYRLTGGTNHPSCASIEELILPVCWDPGYAPAGSYVPPPPAERTWEYRGRMEDAKLTNDYRAARWLRENNPGAPFNVDFVFSLYGEDLAMEKTRAVGRSGGGYYGLGEVEVPVTARCATLPPPPQVDAPPPPPGGSKPPAAGETPTPVPPPVRPHGGRIETGDSPLPTIGGGGTIR